MRAKRLSRCICRCTSSLSEDLARISSKEQQTCKPGCNSALFTSAFHLITIALLPHTLYQQWWWWWWRLTQEACSWPCITYRQRLKNFVQQLKGTVELDLDPARGVLDGWTGIVGSPSLNKAQSNDTQSSQIICSNAGCSRQTYKWKQPNEDIRKWRYQSTSTMQRASCILYTEQNF